MCEENEMKHDTYRKNLNLPRKLQYDGLLQLANSNEDQFIGESCEDNITGATMKTVFDIEYDAKQNCNSQLEAVLEVNFKSEQQILVHRGDPLKIERSAPYVKNEEDEEVTCQQDNVWGVVLEGDIIKDEVKLSCVGSVMNFEDGSVEDAENLKENSFSENFKNTNRKGLVMNFLAFSDLLGAKYTIIFF